VQMPSQIMYKIELFSDNLTFRGSGFRVGKTSNSSHQCDAGLIVASKPFQTFHFSLFTFYETIKVAYNVFDFLIIIY
jgi:hypothetical protein